MNTRVEYLYRDGSNYKQWGAVVFRDVSDERLIGRLFGAVDCGEFLLAHQVRLPELFFTDRPLYADDHCWHELAEVTTTSEVANDTFNRTIDEFVAEVERASQDGWNTFDPWSRESDRLSLSRKLERDKVA